MSEMLANTVERAAIRIDCEESARPGAGNSAYLRLLTWCFALFNSVRVTAYLPTIWAIHQSGDSSQHSLWTWLTWFGANLTTAAWLYEKDGQRLGRVSAVCACNAGMCMVVTGLIVWYRL